MLPKSGVSSLMQDSDLIPEQLPVHCSSFSVSTVDDLDDWDDALILPPASQTTTSRRTQQSNSIVSDRTPLVPRKNRKNGTTMLFGGRDLNWERNEVLQETDKGRPSGLAGFFFGFMYEEACPTDDLNPTNEQNVEIWNRLNWSLFLAYSLTAAATALPVTLIPTAADDLISEGSSSSTLSAFTARATTSAVLGTACGKLLNGPLGDIFGARRVSCVYALLLSLSLLALAFSQSELSAVRACFAVEFCQSVQWPCIIVILATHYNRRGVNKGMYEGGIYVTSLAARFGSLMAIPVSSRLLRSTRWRTVAQCGALVSFTGAVVMFLFVSDSPNRRNDPQNPIRESAIQNFSVKCRSSRSGVRILVSFAKLSPISLCHQLGPIPT